MYEINSGEGQVGRPRRRLGESINGSCIKRHEECGLDASDLGSSPVVGVADRGSYLPKGLKDSRRTYCAVGSR